MNVANMMLCLLYQLTPPRLDLAEDICIGGRILSEEFRVKQKATRVHRLSAVLIIAAHGRYLICLLNALQSDNCYKIVF